MPALPRVSPPTPVFPDSVQPGAVIFRAFPRANALAPAAPRVLPRRIPPLKASSSPRRRVALSRVLPDDPLPARSRDTFRPPASARNETCRVTLYARVSSSSPVAQVVNQGFDAMWESHNKGKLYKHMSFPEPEE